MSWFDITSALVSGLRIRTPSTAPSPTNSRDLPMPKDHLVRVIHALIEGLVLQRLLTPELFPDEVIYAAFGALAAAPRSGSHPERNDARQEHVRQD